MNPTLSQCGRWASAACIGAILSLGFFGEQRTWGQPPTDEQAIREVEAGRRDTANAAWWGFDPEDSTRYLQAALNSKAKRVIIPKMSGPWVVDKIELWGNKEISIEPGVEIVAKRGAFRGKSDSLFTATNQENLTVIGHGVTLRMWRDDYAQPPYEKAEWRHCLSLRGCRKVIIQGLTLRDSGGDGIYLGAGKNGEPNQDIVIRDVVCEGNYRQGISVITAQNLLIENVILRNTGGTPPQAGIDFEPNRPTEVLINCVMRNCVIENNRGYAVHLYAGAMDGNSQPISIRLENCRTTGTNAGSLSIVTKNRTGEAVKGLLEVVNCRFEDTGTAGIIIRSKPVDGLKILFKDCEIVETTAQPRMPAPITVVSRPGDENDLGGLTLDNVTVHDAANRPVLSFNNAGGVCLKEVTGSLRIYGPSGKQTLQIDEQFLARWFPCDPVRKLPVVGMGQLAPWGTARQFRSIVEVPQHRLRQLAHYVFFANEGDHVIFDIAYLQVGGNAGKPLPVQIIGPQGNPFLVGTLGFQKQTRIEFSPSETAVYALRMEPGPNAVRIVRSSHPVAIVGEKGLIHMIGTVGPFYLLVPPDKPLGLAVNGDPPGECVAARLLSEENQLVWEIKGCEEAQSCVLEPATVPRVFCLELKRPEIGVLEDEYISIRGVPAILSFWPEVLFQVPQNER